MSESLEELKAIVDNAEESDSFFDGRYLNSKLHARHHIKKYHQGGIYENVYYDAPLYVDTKKLRSLSDIKRIIELMESQKKTWKAYGSLEAVKQKYNGENKLAKSLLKLAYDCDEFSLPSDLRKDIRSFLGDL